MENGPHILYFNQYIKISEAYLRFARFIGFAQKLAEKVGSICSKNGAKN